MINLIRQTKNQHHDKIMFYESIPSKCLVFIILSHIKSIVQFLIKSDTGWKNKQCQVIKNKLRGIVFLKRRKLAKVFGAYNLCHRHTRKVYQMTSCAYRLLITLFIGISQ